MAKAETSPTAISWPPEGLPIDVACKSIMPPIWAAYVKAQDAARGVDDLLSRIRILSLGADRERLLAEREKARRELDAERDRLLEEGEFELWGRPENPWAEPQRIPASALRLSCLDYERRTAAGEGWLLHDLRLRRGRAARLPRGAPPQYARDAIRAVAETILRSGVPSKKSQFFDDVREECSKERLVCPPPGNDKTMRAICGDLYDDRKADARNKGSNR